MEAERLAVVARVRDDEQDQVDRAVAKLERELSLERLDVAETSLRLASRAPPAKRHERVPRTAIARDRKRDLAVDARKRWQETDEPLEETKLAGVTDGVAVGVHPAAESEPDSHACSTRLIEGQAREHTALDPSELGVGHPGG